MNCTCECRKTAEGESGVASAGVAAGGGSRNSESASWGILRAVEAVRWHALRLFAPCFQADFVARLRGGRRLERERPEMKLRLVQAAAQPVG